VHLRLLATIAALITTLPVTASAAASDAATVTAITIAATKCARRSSYTGPIRVTTLQSVNPNYAVITLSLGVSGDSATRIVMQRTGGNWKCLAGDGGVMSTAQLQRAHVPKQLDRAIITGNGTRQLLKTPAPAPHPKPKSTPHDADADRLFGTPPPAPIRPHGTS
jgi:tetrahydromethanopterin S-methyltransferase subunit D